jgi:hypothetical protein
MITGTVLNGYYDDATMPKPGSDERQYAVWIPTILMADM